MTLLDLLLKKHKTHLDASKAYNLPVANVRYLNQIKDPIKRNLAGFEMLLRNGVEFEEKFIEGEYLVMVKKEKL